jgi:hypothetical protein
LCSSVVQVWWMCTSRPWQLFDFFFNFCEPWLYIKNYLLDS